MVVGDRAGRRESRSGPISLETHSQEGPSAGSGTAQAKFRAWRKERSFRKLGHEVSCSDQSHSGDRQLIIDGAEDRGVDGCVCCPGGYLCLYGAGCFQDTVFTITVPRSPEPR